MAERRLPAGMTPRLLSREAAATYCGISPTSFDHAIAQEVPPLATLRAKLRRSLWDKNAIDHWLDQQSGLTEAVEVVDTRSIEERLNGGDQGARRISSTRAAASSTPTIGARAPESRTTKLSRRPTRKS